MTISNINNSEPLSSREAFAYAVIWMLADEQAQNKIDYKSTAESIIQASQYIDDSYLLEISNADEIISGLREKDVISINETESGVELVLKDVFNVDWKLNEYLSGDIPSEILES